MARCVSGGRVSVEFPSLRSRAGYGSIEVRHPLLHLGDHVRAVVPTEFDLREGAEVVFLSFQQLEQAPK